MPLAGGRTQAHPAVASGDDAPGELVDDVARCPRSSGILGTGSGQGYNQGCSQDHVCLHDATPYPTLTHTMMIMERTSEILPGVVKKHPFIVLENEFLRCFELTQDPPGCPNPGNLKRNITSSFFLHCALHQKALIGHTPRHWALEFEEESTDHCSISDPVVTL
ncbi:hypothetical protein STEG23_000632 [Scotinomys teguina]